MASRSGGGWNEQKRQGEISETKAAESKLGLPPLDHSKSAVLDRLRSPESKRGYRHAIDEFIQWCCSEPRLSFNKVMVTRYRIFLQNRHLAAGTAEKLAKPLGVELDPNRGAANGLICRTFRHGHKLDEHTC